MRKEDHFYLSFAVSLFIFCSLYSNKVLVFLASFLTAYISWLPDIDIKILKKIEKLKRKKLIFYLFYPIIWLIKKIFRHRTITHSLWFPIFLVYLDLFQIVSEPFLFFIRIIYISLILHIFEDALTKTGVDLFYPLKIKLKIPIFSTSNDVHSFIIKTFAVFLLLVYLLYCF